MGQDKFIIAMPKATSTGVHDGIVLRTGGNWSSDQSNALVAHPSADVSIPNGMLTVGRPYSKYDHKMVLLLEIQMQLVHLQDLHFLVTEWDT